MGERGRQWVALVVTFVVLTGGLVAMDADEVRTTSTELRTLLYWILYGVVWLALTVLALRRLDPPAIRAWAAGVQGRRSKWRDRLLMREVGLGFPIWAAFYGFAAGVWALPRAEDLEPERTTLLTTVSVVAVLVSWLVLHATFTLYYAYEFYRADPPGGLDFPGGEAPTFGDFAYFSTMVATTFGTTDVDVAARSLRRPVLLHALLSFVFNTGVLALTLTLLAS
jgi:uncharacterized membrane protein